MQLVLATRNAKKRQEIVELLAGLGLELGDLSKRSDVGEVEETGTTFEENARLKATQVAQIVGAWTLGEDSGLVVPALDGRPGVYSARYAAKQGDDEANNEKLIAELANIPEERRGAFYVTVAALADPAGDIRAVVEGRCGGRILRERRGRGGFGYDPLFLIPEFHQTFGELSPRVKHALSHRARALERLRPVLARLLGSGQPVG